MTSVHYMSATQLLDAYARKALSPVEVTRSTLDRIQKLDSKLNAFCFLDGDAAMASARESEARWMRRAPIGPVDGVTTTIKDVVLTKGWPTRKGSRLISTDGPWNEDSPATARLREQIEHAGIRRRSQHCQRRVRRDAKSVGSVKVLGGIVGRRRLTGRSAASLRCETARRPARHRRYDTNRSTITELNGQAGDERASFLICTRAPSGISQSPIWLFGETALFGTYGFIIAQDSPPSPEVALRSVRCPSSSPITACDAALRSALRFVRSPAFMATRRCFTSTPTNVSSAPPAFRFARFMPSTTWSTCQTTKSNGR
jgi:hypothetical protein